ncbi:hypothetical protein V1477_016694, partial [Vespula maculifrons]
MISIFLRVIFFYKPEIATRFVSPPSIFGTGGVIGTRHISRIEIEGMPHTFSVLNVVFNSNEKISDKKRIIDESYENPIN